MATEDGHHVTFQKVLLRHCQSQFEKNHNEEEMINIQEELDATENVSVTVTLKEKDALSRDFQSEGSRVVIQLQFLLSGGQLSAAQVEAGERPLHQSPPFAGSYETDRRAL